MLEILAAPLIVFSLPLYYSAPSHLAGKKDMQNSGVTDFTERRWPLSAQVKGAMERDRKRITEFGETLTVGGVCVTVGIQKAKSETVGTCSFQRFDLQFHLDHLLLSESVNRKEVVEIDKRTRQKNFKTRKENLHMCKNECRWGSLKEDLTLHISLI